MLDIKPGVHVGPFRLGMSISEAIQFLQQCIQQQNQLLSGFETSLDTVPRNITPGGNNHANSLEHGKHNVSNDESQRKASFQVNKVEIVYDGQNPLRSDIVLRLVDDEIVLRFESKTQRLKFIEINNVNHVGMCYSGAKFSGPNEETTFVKVYQVFGPTYPGFFEKSTCTYYLSYPGVTFVFPIPPSYADLFEEGNMKRNSNNGNNNGDHIMPMEFPDGTTPIATNVFVYNGYDFRTPNAPQDFDNISYADSVLRYVDVHIGKGITVYSDATSSEGKAINFYDTTQDVLMTLGAPNNIFYKKHDKLRIHATKPKKNRTVDVENGTNTESLSIISEDPKTSKELTAVDYFYNYFSLGFDIMFNGQTHLVQKIILHTNMPGSKDFNVYVKCNFKIQVNKSENSNEFITADSKFSQIKELFKDEPHSKPLVNDSTSASNPFGGTRFFAYPNCIFEIMKNEHINSVVLFAG